MNIRLRIIGIVLTLAILAGLGYALYHFQAEYDTGGGIVSHQVYAGRVYMTNDEYDTFKQYLADHPDIAIIELDVLSSDNPLVTFQVVTRNGTAFPWGELKPEETAYKATRASQILMSILVTMGALVLIFSLWFIIMWLETG